MRYGLLGVAAFSLTLPATRVAVASLDPLVVGLGRALVAAILAGALLLLTRQKLPAAAQLRSLAVVASGVIFGFPLLSAWALKTVPAAHSAVVIGLLPLATALVSTVRGGERPSRAFWLASGSGSAAVLAFALWQGGGGLHVADLALLGAVIAGAIGYSEGARLARVVGDWQVICWALVLAAPLLAAPVAIQALRTGLSAPPAAWVAFGYVAVVSQFLGFFAWYRGLALGGVARVSQVQLLQPFLTLLAAALVLGEHVTPTMLVFALVVLAAVFVGRRTAIGHAPTRMSSPALTTDEAEPVNL